jgi:hypothetical protein
LFSKSSIRHANANREGREELDTKPQVEIGCTHIIEYGRINRLLFTSRTTDLDTTKSMLTREGNDGVLHCNSRRKVDWVQVELLDKGTGAAEYKGCREHIQFLPFPGPCYVQKEFAVQRVGSKHSNRNR